MVVVSSSRSREGRFHFQPAYPPLPVIHTCGMIIECVPRGLLLWVHSKRYRSLQVDTADMDGVSPPKPWRNSNQRKLDSEGRRARVLAYPPLGVWDRSACMHGFLSKRRKEENRKKTLVVRKKAKWSKIIEEKTKQVTWPSVGVWQTIQNKRKK